MKHKPVHLTYYFWGLFFSAMVVFGLLTGKVIAVFDAEPKLIDFYHRETDPFFYFLTLIMYVFVGVGLFYKSLLFVSTNREDLIQRDGFDRRFVGLESETDKVNHRRVLWVAVVSVLIILFVHYLYLKL